MHLLPMPPGKFISCNWLFLQLCCPLHPCLLFFHVIILPCHYIQGVPCLLFFHVIIYKDPSSLIMLQHPIQYQFYHLCMRHATLNCCWKPKLVTLCPKENSTNLRGFKVSSNINVTSDVQEPMHILMGGSNSYVASSSIQKLLLKMLFELPLLIKLFITSISSHMTTHTPWHCVHIHYYTAPISFNTIYHTISISIAKHYHE